MEILKLMAGSREIFLRGAFAALNAKSLPYCISRNAGEVYRSATSDVDLVIMPGTLHVVERILTDEAELHGYKLIARIEFTNICLVYWSPGADFVRIDLDCELRWLFFEVAGAEILLNGATFTDGAYVISPQSELFVMADRLAWNGSLSPRYISRVAQIHRENSAALVPTERRIQDFLLRGDAMGLRLYLARRGLSPTRHGIRSMIYAFHDLARMLRRAYSPPGAFVKVSTKGDTIDWRQLFQTMSMAFPESKCKQLGRSPLPGMKSLFRGGILVATDQYPVAAWVCRLFAARFRRFRIVNSSPCNACDLFIPPGSASVSCFADILAAALAQGIASRGHFTNLNAEGNITP